MFIIVDIFWFLFWFGFWFLFSFRLILCLTHYSQKVLQFFKNFFLFFIFYFFGLVIFIFYFDKQNKK